MRECWLRPNRRVLAAGLIAPALVVLVGLSVALGLPGGLGPVRWLAWAMAIVGAVRSAMLIRLLRVPRLAYEDGYLLAYLRNTTPIRIPIDVVECFLLGQAPFPASWPGNGPAETATVVIRLAESAKQWHDRPISSALGRWCDGYITICGAWCEPLNGQLLRRLNRRLVEVRRERRDKEAAAER